VSVLNNEVNEVITEVINAVAEQVYEYLRHKLPEKLLEEVVVNVSLVDPVNYTIEISVDALANPLFSKLDDVLNEAVEFGFKIADYLMDKFKRGELGGLRPGEIERIAREYAKSLRDNAQKR
jgi:formylmethanofuran dehydrogenase subunit B